MDREQYDNVMRKLIEFQSMITGANHKLNERDQVIKEKDARITELTDKLVTISKEKDEALWAKIDMIKTISTEREELHSQISRLQADLTSKDSKLKSIKAKSREIQDGLMGSSFEMDRIKKEMQEKDATLQEYQDKVSSVASGETGIVYDIDIAVEYVLDKIASANRSLRLVIPTIEMMKETGIFDAVQQLPDSCVVNIATHLNLNEHMDIIESWKASGWYIFNYPDENFMMSSANGADLMIGFVALGKISGFYSNIEDLIAIFKQALMHPFVKGQKL